MDVKVASERPPIFISSEIRDDIRLAMGTAHYSYGVVAERFARLLKGAGYAVNPIRMPEKYKRPSDLGVAQGAQRPLHLCFRSTENLRLMPIAANVCHFAWEFDRLKSSELISRPVTMNQVHMLRLMDEIWVPSSYTFEVLRRHGFANLALVPTPVCGTELPRQQSRGEALGVIGDRPAIPLLLSSGLSEDENAQMVLRSANALASNVESARSIALTVCNPSDRRKNLLNIIDGFLIGAGKEDILIVKLTVPSGPNVLARALFGELRPRFNGPVSVYEPRVLFICDFLDEMEMSALYNLADFYISAAHCEGQNLPLLEAMAHGTLTVATQNTATRDIVDETNAVIIPERPFCGLVPELAGEIAGETPIVAGADRFAIGHAVKIAISMPATERSDKVARSRSVVEQRFREPVVLRLIEERLEALQARSAAFA